jgi:hypothetical protein
MKSSNDVKAALSQMAQFVSALTGAAEILESVELAEQRLEAIKKEEKEAKFLLDKHKNDETDYIRIIEGKRQAFIKERDDIELSTKTMRESLQPLIKEIETLKAEREEQQTLFDKVIADMRKDTEAEESKLNLARKAFEDFKKGLRS